MRKSPSILVLLLSLIMANSLFAGEGAHRDDLPLEAGTEIELYGFSTDRELNGKRASVLKHPFGKGRYKILLTEEKEMLAVKRGNISLYKPPLKSPPPKENRFPSLEEGPLDLEKLNEKNLEVLTKILDCYDEPLCCLLDPNLVYTLNLVARGAQIFKTKVVEILDKLTPGLEIKGRIGNKRTDEIIIKKVLLFLRPNKENIQNLAHLIKKNSDLNLSFDVFFVPHLNVSLKEFLIEQEIYHKISIKECPIYFFPLDKDLLTMNLSSSFKDYYLHNDKESLPFIAESLLSLQKTYGPIKNIKIKGNLSKRVVEALRYKEVSEENLTPYGPKPIEKLILLDRASDLVSPLVTGLNYEALVDEFLGISTGVVSLPLKEEDDDFSEARRERKVYLNNKDDLYSGLRSLHIDDVGSWLQNYSQELKTLYESRPETTSSLGEIQKFVQAIPEFREGYDNLENHLKITEIIKNIKTGTQSPYFKKKWEFEGAIMEGVSEKETLFYFIKPEVPISTLLRLVSLKSLCNQGISRKKYTAIKEAILTTYGEPYKKALLKLQKVGLIKIRTLPKNFLALSSRFQNHNNRTILDWSFLKEKMNLLNQNKKDLSYFTSGYAPLSVRIAQHALTEEKWDSSLLRKIPGFSREYKKKIKQSPSSKGEKIAVIFFVGGLTYLEIAALRFIAQKSPYKIVIATTKMINGSSLIEELI